MGYIEGSIIIPTRDYLPNNFIKLNVPKILNPTRNLFGRDGGIEVTIDFSWVNKTIELAANCLAGLFYLTTTPAYLTLTTLSESYTLAMRLCLFLMPSFVYKPANKDTFLYILVFRQQTAYLAK